MDDAERIALLLNRINDLENRLEKVEERLLTALAALIEMGVDIR